ncbi:hypothetical protein [Devosia sp. 2618]|uniref:hypothetical protein n=1 Tax=Devosia sp. 2618 TaxID=3156454 RepID=UPI003399CBA7
MAADEGSGEGSAVLVRAFGALLFVLIFLQKFAVSMGGAQISVIVPCVLVFLIVAARVRGLQLRPLRLVAYLGFLGLGALSQLWVARDISLMSFLALLVLYLPLVFQLRLDEQEWRGVLGIFQRMMAVVAGVVLLQVGWQLAFGWTLSLERVVPAGLLQQGFVYEPVVADGAYMRPNGLFFLETSFVSMFLALALIIEIAQDRKAWRLALLAVALGASFGGTGYVMLAVAVPFLVAKVPARTALWLLALGAAGLAVAYSLGALDAVLARGDEFSRSDSSGYARVVLPFLQLVEALQGAVNPFSAYGAGNAPTAQSSAWPVVKLTFEYGVLATTCLMALIWGASYRRDRLYLCVPLLTAFNFTGGYLHNPVVTGLLFALCALPAVGVRGNIYSKSTMTPRQNWAAALS